MKILGDSIAITAHVRCAPDEGSKSLQNGLLGTSSCSPGGS